MRRSLLAVLLTLAGAAGLEAQVRDRPQNRAQLERRIRQAFLNRLRQELRLNSDELAALQEVIRWSENERQTIASDTRGLNERVSEFLRGGGTEQDARSLLAERAELQARESRLFAAEQERLLEVMTAPQVVRFYSIRDELNARIRRLRMDVQGRPGGAVRDGDLSQGAGPPS